jgi:hypothetical protein
LTTGPLTGNPVAVVHGAGDLDDDTMAALARWTNLSETTFIRRRPQVAAKRIDELRELAAPARRRAGARRSSRSVEGPHRPDLVLGPQRRGAGRQPLRGVARVPVLPPDALARRLDDVARQAAAIADRRYLVAAPPLIRSGPVDADEFAPLLVALDLDPDVVTAQWIDNGPGWIGLLLREPAAVLALAPRSLAGFPSVGVAATYSAGHPYAVEVRAFIGDTGIVREHPVTGSLHAALAQWLVPSGPFRPPTAAVRRGPGQLPRAARTGSRPTPRGGPLDRRHDDHHRQRRTRHLASFSPRRGPAAGARGPG